MAVPAQLFEVSVEAVEPESHGIPRWGTSAKGTASEYGAIAKLLRLGHKVAVPVVDDDGVDLIVNYRTLVQVKSTTSRHVVTGYPVLSPGRWVRDTRSDRAPKFRSIAEHVDIVVIEATDVGWWVMPRDVIGGKRNFSLGPRADQWRDAWSLFDA
jgi:hypothetical protein